MDSPEFRVAGRAARLPTAFGVTPGVVRVFANRLIRHDTVDGGRHQVAGTVKIDDSPDIPVHRRVRLFEQLTGRLVREMWSDPITGAYAFDHIKLRPYFVITHDHLHNYNAVVADNLAPEAMP